MPVTYYTQDEYNNIQQLNNRLRDQNKSLEAMRPEWAQGYTSDSQAAQSTSNAMHQMWEALGVTNQTHAMQKLNVLLVK